MYADAHCDTLTKAYDLNMSLWANKCHIDFERLKKSGCCLQFMAIWTDPVYKSDEAYKRCMALLDFYYSQIDSTINTVTTGDGIKDDKLNILLSVEGGGLLQNDIENLHKLYEKGIRALTLTWNEDNCIGGGIGNNDKGLTNFGKEVIREMNKLGMIVDVSHLSDKGFWQVADLCDTFMASHSNCRRICPDNRNLTDEQIKCLIEHKGFMGINFHGDFLNENFSSANDIKRHINHVINLGGENIIGFGTDFDGTDKLPQGFADVGNMAEFISTFCKKDLLYTNLYGNIRRILKN